MYEEVRTGSEVHGRVSASRDQAGGRRRSSHQAGCTFSRNVGWHARQLGSQGEQGGGTEQARGRGLAVASGGGSTAHREGDTKKRPTLLAAPHMDRNTQRLDCEGAE